MFLKHVRSLSTRFEETRVGFGLSMIWSVFWLILIAAPAAVILKITKDKRGPAYAGAVVAHLLLAGPFKLVGFYHPAIAWMLIGWFVLLLAEVRSELNNKQRQSHPHVRMGFDYP